MFHKYQHKHEQNLYLSTFFRMLKAEAKGVNLQHEGVFVLYLFRDYKPHTAAGSHSGGYYLIPLILSMLSISDGLCAPRLLILVKYGFLLSCCVAVCWRRWLRCSERPFAD